VDIHVLSANGIDLPTALAAAKAIDKRFDPAISIRALQYYGDGTLDRVSIAMQRDLTGWARAVDLGKLPTLHPRRGLSPEGWNDEPHNSLSRRPCASGTKSSLVRQA
jgi:hypothetical protein